MKNKKFIAFYGCAVLGMNHAWAEGLGLPDQATLEALATQSGAVSNETPSFDPADFEDPALGKVRQFERKEITKIKTKINQLLLSAQQGAAWTVNATKVIQRISLFEASELRSDFLKTIPFVLDSYEEIVALDLEEDAIEQQYQFLLDELGQLIHIEIYNLVKEKSATLTNEEWGWVSQMSLYRSLWSMGAWEDDSNYIIAAGAFIVDANKATLELKTKSLEEIKTFLGGDTDNSFFERYEAAGDGMDILKTKYTANKAAIQAKFAEVLAHVAQLENQQ